MCIKFRQIWNVIIFPFLRLILFFFFFAIMTQKMITSDQAPKTYFFALLHLELFPWRHVMKRTKRKKKFHLYVSLEIQVS